MSTPHVNSYTLLQESSHNSCIYKFQGDYFPDVLVHIVDFLKGVGFMEETIHSGMADAAEEYFKYKQSICSESTPFD
jgi:hypothetical protein